MKNKLLKICSLLCACTIIISLLPIIGFASTNAVYYVAKNGSDDNDGSINAPFATISFAASKMQAGDTCYIREGVYYEELSTNLKGTSENEIVFRAYDNENVTISGGQEITNWTQHDGNIYVADMDWNIYSGNGNMVFIDGVQGMEARWPNASVKDLLDVKNYARIDSVNGMTITDKDLLDADLTGAELWCASGVAYWSYLTKITVCDTKAKTVTVSNIFPSSSYYPKADNIYYITRSLALLDTPGEWYKDISARKLYYYAQDGVNPNDITIEAKKREYAIRLTDSSYVSFYGINIRNGLVSFDGATNNCNFYDAVIEGCDYKMQTGNQGAARGFVLGGKNNKISGCEIKDMFGEGITVTGENNYVINNYIHDINFEHTYSDGIYISGKNHLISHNTVTKTGRGSIGGRYDSCVVSYNDLSDSCRLSHDGGTLYFNAHDYKNSEIHHNIIHDSMNNEGLQYALYLDSFSKSLIIYNNLVYNAEKSNEILSNSKRLTFCMNPNSINNVIANNTFINTRPFPLDYVKQDLSGTVMVNNLFRSAAHQKSDEQLKNMGLIFENNLCGKIISFKDFWADSDANDYTLSSDSEAIDKGIKIPGITDNFTGKAPDCGAFEYGVTPWTAGHDFSKIYSVSYALNEKIPYKNNVKNNGFEDGFTDWNTTGNPSLFNLDSWSYFGEITKDGKNSAIINEQDTLSQTIENLKPFTTYKVSAYAMLGKNFVRSYSYKQAYDKNLNDMARLQNAEPLSGISSVGAFKFENVNMGTDGANRLMVGFRYPKAGQVLKIRLGNLESEPIATIELDAKNLTVGWKWFAVDFGETVIGSNDIFICLEGDFNGTSFGGFYPVLTSAEDAVSISAVADSGNTNSVLISSDCFNIPTPSFYVTTGAIGTIKLDITKNGQAMCGYVDCVSVAEVMDSLENVQEGIFTKAISVRDELGNPTNTITKGKFNMFEIVLRNNSESKVDFYGIMAAYDADGKLIETIYMPYSVKADSTGKFLMGTEISEKISKIIVYSWDSFDKLSPITPINSFTCVD